MLRTGRAAANVPFDHCGDSSSISRGLCPAAPPLSMLSINYLVLQLSSHPMAPTCALPLCTVALAAA
eukprot:COSAG04_NODE_23438_length_338_cov_1.062762_1_plen_66_part_10